MRSFAAVCARVCLCVCYSFLCTCVCARVNTARMCMLCGKFRAFGSKSSLQIVHLSLDQPSWTLDKKVLCFALDLPIRLIRLSIMMNFFQGSSVKSEMPGKLCCAAKSTGIIESVVLRKISHTNERCFLPLHAWLQGVFC